MITLQCTLGIVVTNLPVLRPLLFKRSFNSSNGSSHNPSNTRAWIARPGYAKGSIPLYDGPDFRDIQVTGGGPGLRHEGFDHEILKSVEVRVESQSVLSSAQSSRFGSIRNGSK